MDKLRAEFQNKIMGNYDGGVKNWLYRWVEGQVGEYNWEMHMKNLHLRRAILLVPSQRDTDDEKRQKKEEAAMLEAAYLWHKDRLEKTFPRRHGSSQGTSRKWHHTSERGVVESRRAED